MDYPVASDEAASRAKRGRSAIAPPPSQNDAGETAADGNPGDTTPTRATRATQRVGAVGVRHNAEGQDTGGFDRKLQRPNRDDPPPRTEVDDGAWDGIGDSSEDEIDDLAKVALEPEPDEMEATATAVRERLSFSGADTGVLSAGDAMDLGAPSSAAPHPLVQILEAELDGGNFRIDDAWAPRAATFSLAASGTSARRVLGVQVQVLEAFAPESRRPCGRRSPILWMIARRARCGPRWRWALDLEVGCSSFLLLLLEGLRGKWSGSRPRAI